MVDDRLHRLSGPRLTAEFRRRCKRWQRWARAVHLPASSTAMASVDEILDEYNRRTHAANSKAGSTLEQVGVGR